MSQPPSRKPRHALADPAAAGDASVDVPAQTGPADAADGAPVVVPHPARPADDVAGETVPAPAEVSPADGDPYSSGRDAADRFEADPFGGDRSDHERPSVPAQAGGALFEDAPTQAIPVVPRQRAAAPSFPGPSFPGPSDTLRPAQDTGRRGLRLPTLPDRVRPALPAALGLATAAILVLGVVSGVSGVSGVDDQAPVQAPPAATP